MNARVYCLEVEAGEEEGDGEGTEGQNVDVSRNHVLIDRMGHDANFAQRHVRRRDEINFPSRGSSPSCGPAIMLSNMDTLRDNICAAPSSIVTSCTGDRSRAYDIETSCTPTRYAPYAQDASCNVACNAVPATICNIASTTCNIASGDLMGTLPCNDNSHLIGSRQSENTVPRSCQSGPIDVEDLAMYFDQMQSSCKPSSMPINRATYSKRPKYGQSARVDQPRQEDDCPFLDFCNLRSCPALGSSDPRSCDLESNDPAAVNDLDNTGDLTYRDLGDFVDPRSYYLGFNVSKFDNSRRLHDSGYADLPRFYDIPLAYDAKLGRNDLGRSDNPKWSNDWLYNDCPELFNFCSEERWLRCPASDRCPLYDTSYAHGAPAVLPPCLYENLHTGYDNRHYDYADDEQLVADYL